MPKKIRAKKRQKRQNWTRAKKIFTFFFVKFGISGPKNPWNQLFEPLEGHTQKLKNDPQETWPNPIYNTRHEVKTVLILFFYVSNDHLQDTINYMYFHITYSSIYK